MFIKLSDQEEFLATECVDIAYKIHKELGPGLLESVYARCFYFELTEREIVFEKEKFVPINYKSFILNDGLRLDLIVDNLLIVEFKAQESFHPVWEAQILSYLKLTGKRIGLLINFMSH